MPLQFTKADMPKGIYFSDSVPDEPIDAAMAQRLLKIVGHPDYRHKWMVPDLLKAAHLPYGARKSYAGNTIIGMDGLVYSACEQIEYGYGIFSGWTDDEYLQTWLGPLMFFQQERLMFRIVNYTDYLRNSGARGSSATWACSIGTYSDVPLQGCIVNYCFEPNRYEKFGVPAGLRPGDVVEPCMVQPQLNILGQRIADRTQLMEFNLMWGTKLAQLDGLFTGDYCYAAEGNNGQEDGILKFFDNWATRHTELSQACLDQLGPVTENIPTTAAGLGAALGYTVTDTPAAIAQAKMEYVVVKVSQHLISIEWKLREIDGGSTIDFGQVGLLMNPQDAQCMVWYQFCQLKCSNEGIAVFQVSSYAQLNQFYVDFQARLHSGLYGGGVMRLHDGREISIMPLRRIPQGTVVVIVKGWGGSNPNPYAFRLAAMQYNEWWSQAQRRLPMASLKYRLILNGTGVRFEPTDTCGDIENRWNRRLFSNAPWMQLKIVGMPACSDVQVSTWPSFPAMTTYTGCQPAGCLPT